MGDTRATHIFLSEEAHAALMNLADEEGFNVTALIETLALNLDSLVTEDLVKEARRIAASRRRRR